VAADPPDCQVYFELVAIGNAVKVTAIDSVTAIEVSAMESASASNANLERARSAKAQGAAQA
jgi:uncharacterized protein DUF6898